MCNGPGGEMVYASDLKSAAFIGVGQVIRGWDQTVPGHNVGSRLLVSIPPEYGYGRQGMPQAGIGGDDTLVFVIDIISTR